MPRPLNSGLANTLCYPRPALNKEIRFVCCCSSATSSGLLFSTRVSILDHLNLDRKVSQFTTSIISMAADVTVDERECELLSIKLSHTKCDIISNSPMASTLEPLNQFLLRSSYSVEPSLSNLETLTSCVECRCLQLSVAFSRLGQWGIWPNACLHIADKVTKFTKA